MSADNWTTCPQCDHRKNAEVARRRGEVLAAYGTVPVEEFDKTRADFEAFANEPLKNTFREDYEIGIEGADFYVRYRGGCSECDLTHKFEYDATIPTAPDGV